MKELLFVGMGSALGGMARYGVGCAARSCPFWSLPTGTLTANVVGCLLIGFLYGLSDRAQLPSPELRLLLTTGFCGGFTTFSTFMHENLLFYQNDRLLMALLYTAVSLVTGLSAVCGGHALAKLL